MFAMKMKTQKKCGRYPVIGTRMVFFAGLIISAVFPFGVDGNSEGAPGNACATMIPQHGAPKQESTSPYHITLGGASVKQGETVTVSLEGQKGFKGFLIKVEKVGDASGKAQGDWKTESNAQVLKGDCSNGNGLTHMGAGVKNTVTAKWIANTQPGDYQVYYTAVQSRTIYWVKQQTPKHTFIKVTAGAGAAQTSMIFIAILSMVVSSPAVLLRSSV